MTAKDVQQARKLYDTGLTLATVAKRLVSTGKRFVDMCSPGLGVRLERFSGIGA